MDTPFTWADACHKSLDYLKQNLLLPKTLKHRAATIIYKRDASDFS